MEIKTKFDIGDSVWIIRNNKIQNTSIKKIIVEIDSFTVYEHYETEIANHYFGQIIPLSFPVTSLFKTKEDLIASL